MLLNLEIRSVEDINKQCMWIDRSIELSGHLVYQLIDKPRLYASEPYVFSIWGYTGEGDIWTQTRETEVQLCSNAQNWRCTFNKYTCGIFVIHTCLYVITMGSIWYAPCVGFPCPVTPMPCIDSQQNTRFRCFILLLRSFEALIGRGRRKNTHILSYRHSWWCKGKLCKCNHRPSHPSIYYLVICFSYHQKLNSRIRTHPWGHVHVGHYLGFALGNNGIMDIYSRSEEYMYTVIELATCSIN